MNISEALKKRGQAILRKLFEDVQQGKEISVGETEHYIHSLVEEIIHQREGELQLFNAHAMDNYTLYHSLNVCFLSLILAFKMGVEGLELQEVGLGALLHDIGKINTPGDLQWKQKGESDYERVTLNEHPVFGAHWMSKSPVISDEVVQIIKSHHETFHGKGYPDGISTREIPRAVHIVSICNYYDFLVSGSPDEGGVESRTAFFQISNESGRMFSPKIVANFISLMGPMLMDGPLYQKTALVLLDTKEVAAIYNTNSFGDTQPEILILTNSQGKKLARPLTVNLKKDGSRQIVKILRT